MQTTVMQRKARPSRLMLFATAGLMLTALAVYATLDVGAPNDGLSEPTRAPTARAGNAYEALAALAAEAVEVRLEGGRPLVSVLAAEPRDIDTVVEIGHLPLAATIVERVRSALTLGQLAVPREREGTFYRQIIAVANLLALRMSHPRDKSTAEALLATTVGIELSNLLINDAQTIAGLAAGGRVQSIITMTALRILEARTWSPDDLLTLMRLDGPSKTAEALSASIRNAYQQLLLDTAAMAQEHAWPVSRYAYHPNRTKRWWLSAMSPVLTSLNDGDVAGAYIKGRRQSETCPSGPLERNSLGCRMAEAIAGTLIQDIAAATEARMRSDQFRLRCALELYRVEHEKLPGSLDELATTGLAKPPTDPWSAAPYRYDLRRAVLYSIGPNQTDEHGSYSRPLAKLGQQDDFGISLGNEALAPTR